MVDAVDDCGDRFSLCHYTVAYVQALPSIFVILIPAQWSILLFWGGEDVLFARMSDCFSL